MATRSSYFGVDAQIENWSSPLEDTPDKVRTRKLLAGADPRKVGHYGDRDATPKQPLLDMSQFSDTGMRGARFPIPHPGGV